MNIQLISNDNLNFQSSHNIEKSTLNAPKTLDSFDVNIFSLQCDKIWRSEDKLPKRLICSNDLESIKIMLDSCKKSMNIIALPQNYLHYYDYSVYTEKFLYKIEIKDEIDNLIRNVLSSIVPSCMANSYGLIYENSETILNKSIFKSAFCFINNDRIMTKANGGDKATTICFKNFILTTLDLKSPNTSLDDFIKGIGLDNQKFEIPQWLIDYKCFDDEKQQELIGRSNQEIDELKEKIEQANSKLEENLKYKSILSTNGDELVSVVFEILEKTVSCDLSDFVDEGKQDFLIKKDSVTFIGEIKGITSNVRSENVSQLDVHYQSYLDDLRENGVTENVKQLLIINPFRTKPIAEREEVHEEQIKLAHRNGCLIITTETLLKIFEQFQNDKITSDKIVSVFSTRIGLLTMDAFYENEEK